MYVTQALLCLVRVYYVLQKWAASIFHPVCLSRGMSYVLKKTGWKIEPALQTHIKAHPERDI